MKKLSFSNYLLIGTMLFGMFFGAGNLIFPILMGQLAGTNYWWALGGFLITAIGLPFLGILAIGLSGSNGIKDLASRVHPAFGIFFATALYLTIGPFFAIPRTATVPFVVGFETYINPVHTAIWLAVFSLIFFSIVLYFSLNSAKIMDYIGKYLTPIFLLFLFFLVIISIVNPIGSFVSPSGTYISEAFMTGFKEGYNTMDAIASLAFGIIVINAIKQAGITEKKYIAKATIKAGIVTVVLMAVIYSLITYMGASSVQGIGILTNGGQIFAAVSNHYFGSFGAILLAIIIVLACLKTSIGLISACSEYFHEIIPSISYKKFAIILSTISFIIANFGLSNIITFSIPVLMFLYPLGIVLIFLGLTSSLFKHKRSVYIGAIFFTFIISFFDGYNALVKELPNWSMEWLDKISNSLADILPLYSIGLGWLVPAAVGCILGLIIPSKK